MSDDKKWYCLRVISGKERKIKERLDGDIKREGWGHIINQTIVPTSRVIKVRNGKKVTLDQNLLPGYILVEAVEGKINGDIIQSIRSIQNVMHFLGKENPIPMTEIEANRMLGKVDESQEQGDIMEEPFIVGETVKIIDGSFKDFSGVVMEINTEKKKLKVEVRIFGRGTEVELSFVGVEKVDIIETSN
jgi:transcription termination/antitermination protein NusG